jgi:hypothetical protein
MAGSITKEYTLLSLKVALHHSMWLERQFSLSYRKTTSFRISALTLQHLWRFEIQQSLRTCLVFMIRLGRDSSVTGAQIAQESRRPLHDSLHGTRNCKFAQFAINY